MQSNKSDVLVSLEHIGKVFNKGSVNESAIFNDFNFEVKKGQFISIVGSNGSGKTTLLNLICGNLAVDCGKIVLGGKNITALPEFKRSSRIGRVFQDPSKGTCESLSILENMSLADNKGHFFGLSAGANKKRASYYKEQLSKLRLGLEDKLDLPVGALSGGQRQALALLISTMSPIDLLVLDEHTAALDPKSSENVMELTDAFITEKSLTAVMVTHNLKFAVNYGSRLVMMHQGQCVIDSGDDGKASYDVKDLLTVFNEISIECGN